MNIARTTARKPDLVLIAHEAKSLAAQVNDMAGIARHLNAVHGTRYHANDIEKIIAGIKPTASVPRHHPITKIKAEAPICWTPPISTTKGGLDPLAVATNAYLAKYADKIREALA